MLASYRDGEEPWDTYEKRFLDLMDARHIEEELSRDVLNDSCLLCSEHEPHRCHRRLVAEYLRDRWEDVTIFHLGL
jgi:uncharacterized protein (DUF488 family)